MITVAGQIFIEYEKKLEHSNQTIKGYEDYIVDNKIKNDILDKDSGDNVKEIVVRKMKFPKRFQLKEFFKF